MAAAGSSRMPVSPAVEQPRRRAAAAGSQIAGKHDLVADSLLARPVDVGG